MLKISTRLYAAGVLAATVTAYNLNAFAATATQKSAVVPRPLCAPKAGVATPRSKAAQVAKAKNISTKTNSAKSAVAKPVTTPRQVAEAIGRLKTALQTKSG